MKLVIIEDEPAHAELMQRSIRREFPDVQIDCFDEVGSCLGSLDEIDPDIIISDYLLPDMDGIKFLEELRKREKEIPVVVVTGQGDENTAVKAMKLGAYDYIVKSGDFFSLVPSIVQKVLREKELKGALKESQRLYERERKRLNSILASMTTCLAAIKTDLTISFANPIFEKTFGKDLIGKSYKEIFATSKKTSEWCRKAIETGEHQATEFEDSCGRIWQVTVSPSIKGEGDTISAVIAFQDVTERKSYEERLQHLSERMIHLQEEERARISRELHDELGQVLTGLKLDAAWLKSFADKEPDAGERLDEMCRLIDGSIDLVRRLSSDLRPGILDDMGLGPAVEWYASEFQRRSGIECVTLIDLPENRIATHLETGVYRIVQEALTNIARHAKASVATIAMRIRDEVLLAEISDNGIGIESSRIRSPLSTGLSGMRERAEILSGIAQINSELGKGTEVKMSIPVAYR